jgi:hypothetical protein
LRLAGLAPLVEMIKESIMEEYVSIETAASEAGIGVSTLSKYLAKRYITTKFGRLPEDGGRGRRRRLFSRDNIEEVRQCKLWLMGEPRRAVERRWKDKSNSDKLFGH